MDRDRYYIWAVCGYDFKSELIFYEVPTNTNGKMSQQVYLDCILNGLVKEWLDRGDKFVMEEDGDSGHGGGNCAKNNSVGLCVDKAMVTMMMEASHGEEDG